MANYQNLKAAISAAIRTNGNQEITGQVLQYVLNSIVSVIGANYTFAGVATPATNPGTPDQNVIYLAMEGGTYTNFNGTVLPAGISLLMWNGSWTSETVMYGDGGVFDISVYKSSGGNLATYADLAAALDGGNNIPVGVRKGGMSVKFVCSSDNKYVQWRLTATSFTTDTTKWVAENEDFKNEVMQEVNEAIESITPIEIIGDVTNAPDEEDLTSVNVGGTDVLKFKDKAYAPLTYSGLGRKILRKNIVDGVNTLTQEMMSDANTIYVIQYDFTLGEDITIPENCVLEFDGGSLKNGTIIGQNTVINAAQVKIFGTDVILNGSWNVAEAYPEWFGAKGDGLTDDTNAFQKTVDAFDCISLFNNYKLLSINISNTTIIQGNNHLLLHSENAAQGYNLINIVNSKLVVYNLIIDGNYENTTPSAVGIKYGWWSLIKVSTKGSLEIYSSTLKNTRGYGMQLGDIYVGVDTDDFANNCIVQGCTILMDTERYGDDYNLRSCEDAIRIEKCINARILNNRIIGSASGIRCQYYCRDVEIHDNYVSDVTYDVGITAAWSENIRISNNRCSNIYHHGIEVDSCACVDVINNIVEGCGERGLLFMTLQLSQVLADYDSRYCGYISQKYSDVPENYQNGVNPGFESREVVIGGNISQDNNKSDFFAGGYLTIKENFFNGGNVETVSVNLSGGDRHNSKNIILINNTLVYKGNANGYTLHTDNYQAARAINTKVVGYPLVLKHPFIGENDILDFSNSICKNAMDGSVPIAQSTYNDARLIMFKGMNPINWIIIRLVIKSGVEKTCRIVIQDLDKGYHNIITPAKQIISTTYNEVILYITNTNFTDVEKNDVLTLGVVDNSDLNPISLLDCNIYVPGISYKVEMVGLGYEYPIVGENDILDFSEDICKNAFDGSIPIAQSTSNAAYLVKFKGMNPTRSMIIRMVIKSGVEKTCRIVIQDLDKGYHNIITPTQQVIGTDYSEILLRINSLDFTNVEKNDTIVLGVVDNSGLNPISLLDCNIYVPGIDYEKVKMLSLE